MLSMKKRVVMLMSQIVLIVSSVVGFRFRIGSMWPTIVARVRLTMCVRGRIAMARLCAAVGRVVRGKKVPHRKNMGVRNRKLG